MLRGEKIMRRYRDDIILVGVTILFCILIMQIHTLSPKLKLFANFYSFLPSEIFINRLHFLQILGMI